MKNSLSISNQLNPQEAQAFVAAWASYSDRELSQGGCAVEDLFQLALQLRIFPLHWSAATPEARRSRFVRNVLMKLRGHNLSGFTVETYGSRNHRRWVLVQVSGTANSH